MLLVNNVSMQFGSRTLFKEVNLKFINYFLGSTFQNSSKISLADKGNILVFLIPHTINNFIFGFMKIFIKNHCNYN